MKCSSKNAAADELLVLKGKEPAREDVCVASSELAQELGQLAAERS